MKITKCKEAIQTDFSKADSKNHPKRILRFVLILSVCVTTAFSNAVYADAACAKISYATLSHAKIVDSASTASEVRLQSVVTGQLYDGVSGENLTFETEYKDSFFRKSAVKDQPELAKLSMLASAAAYDEDEALELLEQCGFSGDYTENEVTKDDNDHVSYLIGHKKIKDQTVVAVWIRGTSGNYEWISNFNLGENATHDGFSKAEKDLYKAVKKYMKSNGIKTKVKFWITGHSRGAAVGNLFAKRMTDSYGTKSVFAYTFATPRVSTLASDKCEKKYKNIRNYINPGDFITDVAPKEWGYNRFGKDIVFPDSKADDLKEAFKAMTSMEYIGFSEEEKDALTQLFIDFCGDSVSEYYTARESGVVPAEFCMRGLAGSLAGDKLASLYLMSAAAMDEQASKILEMMAMGDNSFDGFSQAHSLPAYLAWLEVM